jgi:hypothetical protein
MLPDQWPLVALEPTKEQFKTVKSSFKVAMSNTYFAPRMRDVLLVMPTGGEQVALFSAHGRGASWDDTRGQSTYGFHGRSGYKAPVAGTASRTDPLRPLSSGFAYRVPEVSRRGT